MKIRKINSGLARDERETLITCKYDKDGKGFVWVAESSIPVHMFRLKKAGWKQTESLVSEITGRELSATFETTTKKPISFRNLAKIKTADTSG